MILAVTLCLTWIVVNLFVMLPKKMSWEENLFLFLVSSITIMFALLIPAKRMYFDDPGYKYSLEGTMAFLTNRNIIFPILTLLSVNLIQYRGFWKQALVALVSLFVFLAFCRLEEKHTIVSSISLIQLTVFFIFYYSLMLSLLKCFRLLAEERKV